MFRIGGDEFTAVLQNEDFQNREQLTALFEKERGELCASTENKWEEPRVAMGLATFDPGLDDSVTDTMRRADKNMYENKQNGKSAR